jgi:hypothetical protein
MVTQRSRCPRSHVTGDVSESECTKLAEISSCCVESSRKLIQDRALYERDNIFLKDVVDFVASKLADEDDADLESGS